nr:transcription/translation regulatory transformer protein RfaH [Pleionea sp. CnH1-48]
MNHWYLATCKPKQESRALENLLNQEIEAFLPEVEVEKVVKGKIRVVVEPLFPGYVFIRLEEDNPLWGKIRSTRGLKDFVRFGGQPASIPVKVIEQLRQTSTLYSSRQRISQVPQKGQAVLLIGGAFSGLQAAFEISDGDSRAYVLLEVLGKTQRLQVDIQDLVVS